MQAYIQFAYKKKRFKHKIKGLIVRRFADLEYEAKDEFHIQGLGRLKIKNITIRANDIIIDCKIKNIAHTYKRRIF